MYVCEYMYVLGGIAWWKVYEYNIIVKTKKIFSVWDNEMNTGFGEKYVNLYIDWDIYFLNDFLIYKLKTRKSSLLSWIITEDAVKKN